MDKGVTKGIILAAGMGTRLALTCPEPKPLINIGGTPVVYRTINSLCRAGIEQLGIVIGYRGDEVKAAVEKYTGQQNLTIQWIENRRWKEPNGLSLYCAREFTREDEFILSMVDHLFDPEIVRKLRAQDSQPGVTLAVDENIERIFDLDDATKVLIDMSHNILRIGKSLSDYNAIDSGLFRCTKDIFPALEKAFNAGNYSISDGMQILARVGLFRGMPIGDCIWQDIDTPEMRCIAEAEITHAMNRGLDYPSFWA